MFNTFHFPKDWFDFWSIIDQIYFETTPKSKDEKLSVALGIGWLQIFLFIVYGKLIIMQTKIVVLADSHFDLKKNVACPERHGEIADILLLRAIHKLNRFIKPNVVIFLGDLIDNGKSPGAYELLGRLRRIVNIIKSPTIVILGNHDGDPDEFYKIFDKPDYFVDINDVRFATFLDPGEPGCNARRLPQSLKRMEEARADWQGPIVTLQHVPLFPEGMSDCPYNYTNSAEVISLMKKHGIKLAISGHIHRGMDLVKSGNAAFVAAPSICESPFGFLEIILDGEEVKVIKHWLKMPEELELVDTHIHTQFAYCGENVEIKKIIPLANILGLVGFVFSEHSPHLYFNKGTHFFEKGIRSMIGKHRRIEDYLAATFDANCPFESVALEVDCDFKGNPVIESQDISKFHHLSGAIHRLPSLMEPSPDIEKVYEEFLLLLHRFLSSGIIRVLVHPFRIFRQAGIETPQWLFKSVIKILLKENVAAEINFHTNEPSVDFTRLCIEAGVKITFGSDAHNLSDVGEFTAHLDHLLAAGFDGNPKDILFDPRR